MTLVLDTSSTTGSTVVTLSGSALTALAECDGTNDVRMTYRPLAAVARDFLENKNFNGHWSWKYKEYMISNGMFGFLEYEFLFHFNKNYVNIVIIFTKC